MKTAISLWRCLNTARIVVCCVYLEECLLFATKRDPPSGTRSFRVYAMFCVLACETTSNDGKKPY
eukprot:m.28878 g.28878  ORF g.28878 m.28878 type:complete len:65 (-) comp13662_c0_seq2:3092-3286(-)